MNAFECVKKELDVLVEQGMPLCGVTVRKNHEKLFEYGVNITNDQRLFLCFYIRIGSYCLLSYFLLKSLK